MHELKFIVRLILRHVKQSFKRSPIDNLSPLQEIIVGALRKDGCFILNNHYSLEQCASLQNELSVLLENPKIDVWRDKEGSDKRIYGANLVSTTINQYYLDPFINKVVDHHEKSTSKVGFTMAARMDFAENNQGSGGGWHRDRTDRWQTKSLLYLTTVGESHGPFQYLKGSHKPFQILKDWIRYGIKPTESRLTDEQVKKVISNEPTRLIECKGEPGTVLFANTLGIHQGKPIQEGYRLAMTNYFWADMDIPAHIKSQLQRT